MAAPIRSASACAKLINYRSIHQYGRVFADLNRQLSSINPRKHNLDAGETQVCQRRGMCYEARKVDISGSRQQFMFDTHALVKSLEDAGFNQVQSEEIVQSLVALSHAKMDHMNKNLVTKSQQEIMLQQMMSHISSVKKDMIILEKSEFSALKHEYEKQHIEIGQMKQHFEDEVTKLRSGILLDLNLEKSRAKEAHSLNERQLAHLVNQLEIERKENDKQTSSLDNKIEKEIANLLATYERYRNDVMKYAGGTVLTCLTLCLGFLRLWS